MVTYETLLNTLRAHADEEYRVFHRKLLKNDAIVTIGVRMPVLRRLARTYGSAWETLLAFPDEYYEVTLLKCLAAARLPFSAFSGVVDGLVERLDNWAACDAFDAPCIRAEREAFVPYLKKYLADGREFVARFAFTTMLHSYVEREYLPLLFESLRSLRGDAPYYTVMGAAWLLAEILVKFYPEGEAFLAGEKISGALRRAAVRKACESFRVDAAQKARLRAIKG